MKKIAIALFVSFFIFLFIAKNINKGDSQTANLLDTNTVDELTPQPEQDLKTKISEQFIYFDIEEKNLLDIDSETPYAVVESSKMYDKYAKAINAGEKSDDKEILKLTSEYKRKVIVSQKINYPKLRKRYFEILKKMLWKVDIDVSLSGPGNTVMTFVGGVYAANARKQETMNSIDDAVTALRFKRINFKWIKHEDEYTFYDLKTSPDNIIL